MGVISRFEGGLDSAFNRAAGSVFRGPIEPAQIAKRAEKHMNHEKLVGAGKQYAPTLYTVLVNPSDDRKLFAFYPTIAAEIETYLVAKGTQNGLKFDGRPLVRFIVDKDLKSGKFDVVAENVAAPIVKQLREEELEYYGLATKSFSTRTPEYEEPEIEDLEAEYDRVPQDISRGVSRGTPQDAPQEASQSNAFSRRSMVPSLPSLLNQARLTDLNAGKSYALTTSPLFLGRDASCDIAVSDANISRRHAQFTQDAVGTWKITDLNSTNGTKLNGRNITTAFLRDGDQITIGVTVLEFREH